MVLLGAAVWVTGGSRGIGAAIARAFVAEGARVAISSRDETSLVSAARDMGANVFPAACDVGDPHSVAHAAAKIRMEMGPIDVLVANAARLTAMGPTWEVEPAAWLADLRTNLEGSYFCCREVLPWMVKRQHGCVILLSSGAGVMGPFPFGSAYGLSKLGMAALAESLAHELSGTGVTVFAVNPGTVRTAMTEAIALSEAGRRYLPHTEKALREGQVLPPERAAELCVSLARGDLDALTGRFLSAGEPLESLKLRQESIVKSNLNVVRLRQ
ncbi:MAG: SDR family oxidoreductase [Armatimonadota bacterium]|nr:SDR family oxidoreductase [Armatimonadota bacterium]